jgi:two-component system, OmpR family, alkaline phosphatase synthesis response regulator PhoP
MPKTVLVAEDEPVVARGLRDALEYHGFRVEVAEDGPAALEAVRSGRPDLLVLDIVLPGIDGFEVCRRLRAEGNHIPTLMLTARAEEEDRVHGLEVGADDYVVKPFGIREVLARVQALFRRLDFDKGLPTLVEIGAARADFQAMTIHRDGGELEPFPDKEAGILRYLVENPDRVVTRDELLLNVWDYPVAGIETRTVDNYILRLRQRVEPDPKNPTVILTVRGRGYRLGEVPA